MTGGLELGGFKVCFNPNHSMILLFCDSVICWRMMKMTGGCKWHLRKGLGLSLVWLRARKAEDQSHCFTNIQLVHDGKGTALEQGSGHVGEFPSLVILKTQLDQGTEQHDRILNLALL